MEESQRTASLERLQVWDTGSEELFDGFTELLAGITGAHLCLINLVSSDQVWVKSATGIQAGFDLPRGGSFCGHTVDADDIFEVPDARLDARFGAIHCVRTGRRLMHYAGAPLRLPDGQRVGSVCVLRDAPGRLDPSQRAALRTVARLVTQALQLRQRQLEVLEVAETRASLLSDVLEHMPAAITVFDRELRLEVSNALAPDYLDLPAPLLQRPGVTFGDLARHVARSGGYGPGEVESLVAERIRRARTAQPAVWDRTLPDGRVIEGRASAMADGRCVATYADVTAARASVERVRQSEQTLKLALAASRTGVWQLDLRSGVITVSADWALFLGVPQLLRFDAAAASMRLMTPQELAAARSQDVQLLKGRIPRAELEHQVIASDGSARWLHTAYQVAERDADGRASRLVGTSVDVTERVQSRIASDAALDAAQAATQAKTDFLSTMSHEIRTPLNGVLGMTQLLAQTTLDDRQAGHLRVVQSCATALMDLVNDVLDFARIESGKLELRAVPTELPALVRGIGEIFSAKCGAKGLAFSLELGDEVPARVLLDGPRLRQVLMNLLGNAVKFTDAGRVSLAARCVAGRLQLEVADTGCGIAAHEQPRLFERFAQADSSASRRYQGAGLGLAISQQLAKLMGGDIRVHSTFGRGSIFTVNIPVGALEPGAGAAPDQPQATAGPMPPAVQPRILLVEDNEVNQIVTQELLAASGYLDVTCVADGKQCFELCMRQPFDLVLMDCQMPVMNGYEATRLLRLSGWSRPVIALTANATTADRQACMDHGMDDYVTKPVDGPNLAAVIARWLRPA